MIFSRSKGALAAKVFVTNEVIESGKNDDVDLMTAVIG